MWSPIWPSWCRDCRVELKHMRASLVVVGSFAALGLGISACSSSSTQKGDGASSGVTYSIHRADPKLVSDIVGYSNTTTNCVSPTKHDCQDITPDSSDAEVLAGKDISPGANLDQGVAVVLVLVHTQSGRECVGVATTRDGRSTDTVSCVSTLDCNDLCFAQRRVVDNITRRFIGGIAQAEVRDIRLGDRGGAQVIGEVGPAETAIGGRRAFLIEIPFRVRSVEAHDERGDVVAQW